MNLSLPLCMGRSCSKQGRQAHLAGVVLNLFARRPTGRGRLATSRERDAGHLPPPNARNADGRATGCRPIPSWGRHMLRGLSADKVTCLRITSP